MMFPHPPLDPGEQNGPSHKPKALELIKALMPELAGVARYAGSSPDEKHAADRLVMQLTVAERVLLTK